MKQKIAIQLYSVRENAAMDLKGTLKKLKEMVAARDPVRNKDKELSR